MRWLWKTKPAQRIVGNHILLDRHEGVQLWAGIGEDAKGVRLVAGSLTPASMFGEWIFYHGDPISTWLIDVAVNHVVGEAGGHDDLRGLVRDVVERSELREREFDQAGFVRHM